MFILPGDVKETLREIMVSFRFVIFLSKSWQRISLLSNRSSVVNNHKSEILGEVVLSGAP